MNGVRFAFLAAYLAVLIKQTATADDAGSQQAEKKLPQFKVFTIKFTTEIGGVYRNEELYYDGEKRKAKRVVTQGAQMQTITHIMETEGEFGTKIVTKGRYGTSLFFRPCYVTRGTQQRPMKINRLFINLAKYKFAGMAKWNSIDVETWVNKLDTYWYIRRDGEKITLLEKVTARKVKKRVNTFRTTPIDDNVFKYIGSLDKCKEKSP